MQRKGICLLLVMAMGMSLLAGCGGKEVVQDSGNSGAAEQEIASESDSAEIPSNTFSFCSLERDKSAVITYDPEKVELVAYNMFYAQFESVADYNENLMLNVEADSSAQDLYDRHMEHYFDNADYTVSELKENEIGGLTGWYSEVSYSNGVTVAELFVLELDNGMLLYIWDYEKSLKKLLPYILVDVTEGDGTWIEPALAYEYEVGEDVMTLRFASGESFSFEYDPNIVELRTQGQILYVNYLASGDNGFPLSLCLSNNYASASEFFEYSGCSDITEFVLDGQSFPSVFVGESDFYEDTCYIDFGNGYSMWGNENNSGQPMNESLEVLFGTLVGVEKPAWFDYTVPTALGEDTTSMIYQLEGELYRFPTPISAFIDNGWSVKTYDDDRDVEPGEYYNTSLSSAEGHDLNVTVYNGTSESIPMEECLVTGVTVRNEKGGLKPVIPGFSGDGALVSVFHSAITFPKLKALGTHTSEEKTTLIWESEDGHSRLSVICYTTDEYGDVKRIEYSYE